MKYIVDFVCEDLCPTEYYSTKVEKYGFVCSFRQLSVFHGCEGTRYRTLDHFDSLSQSNSMGFGCNPRPSLASLKGKKSLPSDYPSRSTDGFFDHDGMGGLARAELRKSVAAIWQSYVYLNS